MACPPGNCAAWGAFRLCKPLPPIVIDGSYTPDELQLLWFCWRARSTGEYGGTTPVDLGFDSPGLIDISKTTNIAKIVAYCDSRGTLVRQFTNFSRFGVKFNLPNFKAAGSFSTWSGGIFGGATSPGGGGGGGDIIIGPDPTGVPGGGGAATCPCTPDGGSDLTVVVCTELDCDNPSPVIELTVCGGTAPYTWSLSGFNTTPTLVQSGANGRNALITVLGTTNNFAGVAAYARVASGCVTDDDCLLSAQTNFKNSRDYDCDGVAINTCINTGFLGCSATTFGNCIPGDCIVGACSSGNCSGTLPFDNDPEPCQTDPLLAGGAPCDKRTQEMKDDGCQPCEVQMHGGSITVEDAVGATVVTVVSA